MKFIRIGGIIDEHGRLRKDSQIARRIKLSKTIQPRVNQIRYPPPLPLYREMAIRRDATRMRWEIFNELPHKFLRNVRNIRVRRNSCLAYFRPLVFVKYASGRRDAAAQSGKYDFHVDNGCSNPEARGGKNLRDIFGRRYHKRFERGIFC